MLKTKTALNVRVDLSYPGRLLVCGMFGLLAVSSESFAQQGGVGYEMSDIQKEVLEVKVPVDTEAPAVDINAGLTPKEDGKAAEELNDDTAAPHPTVSEAGIVLAGDWNALHRENLYKSFENTLVEAGRNAADVQQVLAAYQQMLIDRGYLLAKLTAKETVSPDGRQLLEITVDLGRYGDVSLYSIVLTPEGVPVRDSFQERFFSSRQILRKISGFDGDEPFNYNDFYRSLYDINMHPDLTLNARLRLRRDEQRYIDMEMTVEESLPLHAILEISNTGTESTEEWRAGLTFQHLNLFRQDDVLTMRGINATDFSSLNSMALSYRLPYYLGKGGALTAVGGYSRIDSEEIFKNISIRGSGWFGGLQGAHRVVDTQRHVISLGLGGVYRNMEDQLVFDGNAGEKREADALPFSLSLSYASKRDDMLRGRNYLTLESAYNLGSALEMSSDEQFNNLRQNAEESYFIQRLQIARLQSLCFGDGQKTTSRDWSLFFKFDGQVADGALIPAEQFAVGGMNTVRGYEERTLLGDHGGVATIELRAPILQDVVTRPLSQQKGQQSKQVVDRLQALIFVDAGFISRTELLQGEERSESIASAGMGLRWALSRYAQVRADVGYRIEELLDQDTGVGIHVSAQIQY